MFAGTVLVNQYISTGVLYIVSIRKEAAFLTSVFFQWKETSKYRKWNASVTNDLIFSFRHFYIS